MRSLFLVVLTSVIFFPTCKTMHGGGMHGSPEKDQTQNTDSIHVSDDHFHIDIHVEATDPVLAIFTITDAETGHPAQNISGFLRMRETEISSELKADIAEEGRYSTNIHLSATENDSIPMLLTIENEQGMQSAFYFTLTLESDATDQQNSSRRISFLKTKILVGSAIGVAKLLWLFGVF